MTTMTAITRGVCPSCRTEYRPGQVVGTANGKIVHASCMTQSMTLRPAVRATLRKRPQGHRF